MDVHGGADPAAGPGDGATRADRARRVAHVLRGQVLRGAFPGGVLPDERALVAEFGTSRNSVREALGLLRDEGLVERRRGVGTVIVGRAYEHPLGELSGLAEVLQRHGTVVNEVRAARTVRAPASVTRRLELPDGSGAVYLERLRRVDGMPLSLDCTYLIPEVGEPLLALGRERLESRDVFELIERVAGDAGRADADCVYAVPAPAPPSSPPAPAAPATPATPARKPRRPTRAPASADVPASAAPPVPSGRPASVHPPGVAPVSCPCCSFANPLACFRLLASASVTAYVGAAGPRKRAGREGGPTLGPPIKRNKAFDIRDLTRSGCGWRNPPSGPVRPSSRCVPRSRLVA
ncbi:GntR family transcriptional regulator [Streptomyces sp. NPDC020883]|uniref:GntR family transcriptional regulator n=1 Tax=Streptomyces sp. NPDC020883 TaxID=3365099 RepID=UPI0037A0808B